MKLTTSLLIATAALSLAGCQAQPKATQESAKATSSQVKKTKASNQASKKATASKAQSSSQAPAKQPADLTQLDLAHKIALVLLGQTQSRGTFTAADYQQGYADDPRGGTHDLTTIDVQPATSQTIANLKPGTTTVMVSNAVLDAALVIQFDGDAVHVVATQSTFDQGYLTSGDRVKHYTLSQLAQTVTQSHATLYQQLAGRVKVARAQAEQPSTVDTRNLTQAQIKDWVMRHLKAAGYDMVGDGQDPQIFSWRFSPADDAGLLVEVREDHDYLNAHYQVKADPNVAPMVGVFEVDPSGHLVLTGSAGTGAFALMDAYDFTVDDLPVTLAETFED